MTDNVEKLVSKWYFPEVSKAFLGNKKFDIVIRNKNPDYNFVVNTSSVYNFTSNKNGGANSPTNKKVTYFSLKHQMNFGNLTLQNRYRPYDEVHLSNSVSWNMGRGSVIDVLQRASRKRGLYNLGLRYKFKKDALNIKNMLEYNAESQNFDFSTFVVNSFNTGKSLNGLLPSLAHTGGVSMNVNLNTFKLKTLDMFYHILLDKHQFLLAHLSENPTFENFLGTFIFGYIRKSSEEVKTIIKMIHDYQSKETSIDLVRESQLTEKAVIRNKITSGYNIGTSLTYNINDNIRICHSAEADLRKFFKMEENYKYGVRLEVDL